MAAIYTGIHQKLKSSQTPWSDKLKLAQFAWASSQCILPNKEQVLLDWTVHALSCYYSKKVKVPLEVVERLWTYLDDVLNSKKLSNVLSQGKNITLNPAVSQIINERILEGTTGMLSISLSTVLSCCHGILTSPVLSVSYTARYDLLVDLLVRICGLACFQLSQHESSGPLRLKVFEVLFLVLSTYLTVQKQQGNTNRVFTQVTEHLLQPLCLLRHLLTTRAWAEEDDLSIRQHLNKDIRCKVDLILQSALFFHDRLPYYKEEVLPSERGSGPKKGSASNTYVCPVATILSKLVHGHGDDKEALFYAVRCNSLQLLFKFALDSFCKEEENKLLCFHIMTKFVTTLDFTEDLSIKETFNTENWSLVLLSLENILNSCLAGDIYNVAADRIHHKEVQLRYYRKVARLLFNNAQTDVPAWYRCLKTLLALNHQILEPDLDELISSAWVDADNFELRVKKARETLMCAVIQTYAKLRQLPRLFEELLVVICRPAADELRQELLPEAVQKSLSQCLLDNPPSQNLEICRLILKNMPNVREMRNESALKLFFLSILLHAVIFNLKTLDDSTPVPTVRQTQSLMEEMFKFVRSLLQYLEGVLIADIPWGEKIQETALLLTHTWHEADALFQIHCSKYQSPAGANHEMSPVCDTIEKVLAQTGSAGEVSSALSRLLQKLLALQRMKKHLLVSPSAETKNILCEIAQYVVNRQEPLIHMSSDQTWDLQLCSVNSDTYSVAYWFVVTTNLPLIAPYLSQEDASYIADTMLNSLLQSDFRSSLEKMDQSIFLISKQLLESMVLCELPQLHSAVVTSITKRIFEVLCASDVPSFLKSSAEFGVESVDKEEHMADFSPSLRRLKSIAREVMNCVETGVSILVSEAQVSHLLKLVKITSVLNPHAMSPEDYLELFLCSFLMNICVQRDGNEALSVPISLSEELFKLMALLLMRQNSYIVLKVVHGSTLLEAAMTSVSSCFSKGLSFSVDNPAWFPFLQSVQGFIQCLIQLIIIKKNSTRINLEKFANFMIERVPLDGTSSGDSGEYEEALYVQLHLATMSTLCKELIPILGKTKQLDQTVIPLLEKIVSIMGPAIQAVLTGKAGSMLRQSFFVDVVTVMIKSELAKASHQTEHIVEGNGKDKISHIGFYKSFGQQILRELCPAARPMDFLNSSIHYLSAFYLAAEANKELDLKDLRFTILQHVHTLLSGAWMSVSEVKELEAPVKDMLAQLMGSCSKEQFHLLFLLLRDGLGASKVGGGCHTEVLASLTLIKLLACCSLPDTCSKAFWLTVPQILSSLVFVIRESSEVASLTSALTVPAVETLTTLLRQGESWLSNPHHVIIGLGALHFVPLDSHSMDDYYSAFLAIHEALFAIILCYPKVMLKAAPTFLNCFYRLVTSIMHEGRQKGEKEREKDFGTLLKCAMLVERMYTHIGNTADGFTVLSSFIVAQYVSELQRVTLQPEIKAHLTEGIYHILDSCAEQHIKFLNRTLQMGVKEVFRELYKNYVHYHKSQRQGEEKYTA